MMKNKWLGLINMLISTTLILSACGGGAEATAEPVAQDESVEQVVPIVPIVKEEVVQVLSIPDVYDKQKNLLDSQITVEGYYSLDGPSYLLSDYEYAVSNTFIPIESMLILFNDSLSIQDISAYIQITGILVRYNDDYPDYIDDNGEFLALEVQDWKLINPPYAEIQEDVPLTLPEGYLEERIEERPPCLWTLIISGAPFTFPGTKITARNHSRYWNNVLFSYQMSTRMGAQWIRALYSTGAQPAAFIGQVPGSIPAADLQAATRANLLADFITIGQNMPQDCQLWIITTDHGVGWSPPNKIGIGPGANYMESVIGRIDGAPPDVIVPEGDLFPGDENLPASIGVGNVMNADQGDDVDEGLVLWKSIIYDDSFTADLFSNVNNALDAKGFVYKIYIMMAQCYSGGFIADLFPIVVDQIATSASEDQSSHVMRFLDLSQFLYYFISALNGTDPWGRPNPLPNPDFNGDGQVDWSEAYQYALIYKHPLDDPQFR